MDAQLHSALQAVDKEVFLNSQRRQSLLDRMLSDLQLYLLKKEKINYFEIQQIVMNNMNTLLFNMEEEFFLDNPTDMRHFYDIADKYGYFYKGDIQNILSILTKFKYKDYLINRFEGLKDVESILAFSETGNYRIDTSFGIIPFLDASKMYPDEVSIMEEVFKERDSKYFQRFGLKYSCHFAAIEFAKLHPDYEIVTSLCPHIFSSTWWVHSYVISPDGKTVLDFANNVIMDIDSFRLLFEPIELCRVKYSDLKRIKEQKSSLSATKNINEDRILMNCAKIGHAKQLLKR